MEKPKEILELEKIIGKEIEETYDIDFLTVGYKSADNKIIGLGLYSCNLEEIHFIETFPDLIILSLSSNNIENIYDLKNLINLNSLDLSSNKRIKDISVLQYLFNLKHLDLSYNKNVKDISPLQNLTNLERLELTDNQVTDISALQKLTKLKILYLVKNKVENIIDLQNYKSLEVLSLWSNNIQEISALKNQNSLIRLDLGKNPIKKIPDWITNFPKMDIQWKDGFNDNFITFYNNPIENIPIEIIKQGKKAIKDYFEAQRKGEIENNFIKLILTGNTRVGKSTLVDMLTTGKCEPNKISTHGVEINPAIWTPEGTNLKISIWDFGGQEYYHATHRLFFSDNSLYLLVWTKEKNNNGENNEEIPVYSDEKEIVQNVKLNHYCNNYWLQNIRHFDKNYTNSPILMLQTKLAIEEFEEKEPDCTQNFGVDKQDFHIDTLLANEYKNIEQKPETKKFLRSYEDFYEYLLKRLEETIIPKKIPIYWGKIRDKIIEIREATNYLPWIDYEKLCREIDEQIELETLTKYLHNTGILLHYADNELLKEKVFVKPEYLTKNIYRILDLKVKEQKGKFTREHAVNILGDEADMFIELMKAERFELIFEEPEEENTFIAVQYLDEVYPDKKLLNNAIRELTEIGFVLKYPAFMPKNIMIRFLSRFGKNAQDSIYWKNGIVFGQAGISVFVEADFSKEKQTITVKLSEKNKNKPLIKEIFEAFQNINNQDNSIELSFDGNQFAPLKLWYENSQVNIVNFLHNNLKFNTKDFLNLGNFKQHFMSQPNYIIKNIFTLIDKSFNDTDLQTFCMCNFDEVYNSFGNQSKTQKVQSLIDYCKRKLENEKLLELMKTENPAQYEANKPYFEKSETNLNGNSNGKQNKEKIALTEKEIEGLKSNLDLLVKKKNALSKSLITAYDEEKKFALEELIADLEKQIKELKLKLNIIDMPEYKTNSNDITSLRKEYFSIGLLNKQNLDKNFDDFIPEYELEELEKIEKSNKKLNDNLETLKDILLIHSNPEDYCKIDFEHIFTDLKNKYNVGNQKKEFSTPAPSLKTKYDKLHNVVEENISNNENKLHLIHILTHGTSDLKLLFEDDNGYKKEISIKQFCSALSQGLSEIKPIECIFFSSCHSSKFAEEVVKKGFAKFAIGMNNYVNENVAYNFSKGFYESLFNGKDIKKSYDKGIHFIGLEEYQVEEKYKDFEWEKIPEIFGLIN